MPNLVRAIRRAARIAAVPLVERGYRPDPVYLFLEMNRKCNHRCTMCGIWKEQTDGMPTTEIERIFSQKLFNKLERVILAGGEPMMRKDLVEVARFFVGRLKRLQAMAILTNGFNTSRTMEVANGILDVMDAAGNGQFLAIQISLDAIGPLYDQIRGIKHAWTHTHETVSQISELRKKRGNLTIMLHVVMQPPNLHQLDEIDAFAREFGAPVIFSPAVISQTYFSNTDSEANLTFSSDQKEFVKTFLRGRNEAFTEAMPFYYQDVVGMLDGAPRGRKCMMGYHHMYVRMDGAVFPCINSGNNMLGDLKSQRAAEVWRGPKPEASRRKIRSEYCPTCPSACDNDVTSVKEMLVTLQHKYQRP